MDGYEAAQAECGLAVWVGPDGAPPRVRLTANSAKVPAVELAGQIVRLHTLAYMRRQVAMAASVERQNAPAVAPTAVQVETYARTIDF
jgi:hypothetical protein